MTSRISRREAIRFTGLGAAALVHAPLLPACSGSDSEGSGEPSGAGGSAGSGAGGMGGSGDEPFERPPLDPDTPWWLQGAHAPTDGEHEAMDLEIQGALPPELDGVYMRNGPNQEGTGHWFLGNGMLHGVRIQGGKALWYRNRYVDTPVLAAGGYDNLAPDAANNASNVSVMHHGGKVLTTGEVGFPYEIEPSELSTVGVVDFGGALTSSFTAHPKIDQVTGEMLSFGYGFAPPYVTYNRHDPTGAIVQTETIDIPQSVMMHDFQITATRAVFFDLPILFSPEVIDPNGPLTMPFLWKGENGSRIGIMPREGTQAEMQWFEIENCFIFHSVNAYDHPTRDGVVVLEVARHPAGLWESGPNNFDTRPVLYRYEFDLNDGTVIETQLDDRLMEFSQLDRRLVGQPNRYAYGVWINEPSAGSQIVSSKGMLKYDRENDTSTMHELPPHLETAEAYFVQASADAAEDEGYLMSYVYDWKTDKSELYVLDASDVAADPIARVKLPYRVPTGFHGMWIPA